MKGKISRNSYYLKRINLDAYFIHIKIHLSHVLQQSGRAKRYTYLYVSLLRPPLPKACRRGGRQFFLPMIKKINTFFFHFCFRQFKESSHFVLVYFFQTPSKFQASLCHAQTRLCFLRTFHSIIVCSLLKW